MRLRYKSEKYIQYLLKKTRRSFKRRKKKKNKLRAARRSYQGKSLLEVKQLKSFSDYIWVKAPKKLLFLENANKVIGFINTLEGLFKKRKKTYIVIKDVEQIDYGAITVLLSVMIKFKESGIGFNGDFPKNEQIKKKIVESGFFECLLSKKSKTGEYKLGQHNQIITHAQKNVSSELGLPIMEEVSTTIWGSKKVSKGLQRILVELMQNTNNHAVRERKGEKHWWLSVNHDKENRKVSFVFMDYGIGIFSSLHNKSSTSKWYGWSEKIKNVFGSQTDEKVLQLLLEGQLHLTVTGEKYRGKGLPGVNLVLARNQVSNLHIITNNVYSNVAKRQYDLLSEPFGGTFFYWELCNNNDKLTWTIK